VSGWSPEKVSAFRESFNEFRYHVKINSKETGGGTVLAEHIYLAQTMFDDAVFYALERDIHDVYCLKSRQLGVSTDARAFSTFWLGMHDGLRGAMVFDTSYNTQLARREVEEVIDGLPKKLHFPKIKGRNRDALVLENDSWLLFMQAGTKNSRTGGGLGRSTGINYLHGSELCSWVNEEGITSLRQSLAETFEDRLYIWESTARGYNAWYRMWSEAKADPSKHCCFIGWWAKETQMLARDSADFSRYGVDSPNQREIERMRAVQRQYGYRISLEQLAWYRKKVDPSRELDDDDPEDSTLTQEQPWTEEEAYQVTGSNFFQSDKITEAAAQIASASKPQYFKFWPGIDFVTSEMKLSHTRREIELMLWEEPASESMYVVAGDPAFGHDENNDHSSAEVLRCYADGIDQVAEYESGSVQPHQFAWLLWTLVGYYGSKSGNQVGMIVDINGPGEEVWRHYQTTQRIVQQGYLRQAAREKGISDIFNNARSYIYTRSDSMNAGHSWQFKAQQQLKVQIMEATRNYFHNGLLAVRSTRALEQMKGVTRDGDTIGAEGRNRDDHVYAMAMGVRYWEDRFRRGMIAGNRTREAERAKLSISVEDQWALWNRNTLADFFRRKEGEQLRAARQMQQAAWRRAATQRRW
jgi:hypothetical protein